MNQRREGGWGLWRGVFAPAIGRLGRRLGSVSFPTVLILLALSHVAAAEGSGSGSLPVSKGAETYGPFEATRVDIDLRNLGRARAWQPGDAIKMIPRRSHMTGKLIEHLSNVPVPKPRKDALLGRQAKVATSRAFTTPDVNIAGQGYSGVQPPDTVGDVGPFYYIQMINGYDTTFIVYNKADGSVAAGPIALDSLGSGECANGAGDPIVLYDELADRWVLSEFSSNGNRMCVYVAQTPDPISGGWYNYDFQAPSFPDYPKYAVWPDGYYVGTNESGGPAVYVFERTAMLNGNAATMQRKTVPALAGFGFQMVTPADHDGDDAPPTGSPAYFLRHKDDEAHSPGSANPSQDTLEIFEMDVDWANSSNTTLAGPTSVVVAEFDSELCGLVSYSCIPQPSGGAALDPLREVVMWRPQYRNFGSYEALIGNHSTDVDGNNRSGIRWWELRRSGGGPWVKYQEGTFAPNTDAHHRWMGSIAMDSSGGIAVGYSIGGASLATGIAYTGRAEADPLGTMTETETVVQQGGGTHSGNRWGDYSSMNVDPVDQCTFWYTNEWAQANGTWATNISSFKFDDCGGSGFQMTGSNLNQAICKPNSLANIEMNITAISEFSNPVTLSLEDLPADFSGSFAGNPVSPGGSSDLSVVVGSGASTGLQEFTIRGTATEATDRTLTASVHVADSVGTPTLVTPLDGTGSVSTTPTFTWNAASQADSYVLEVAEDSAFSTVTFTADVDGTSQTVSPALESGTEYFWRVSAVNACGSALSSVRSFTTSVNLCLSPQLSIPDANIPGPLQDTMTVSGEGALTDIDVSLQITHTYVGDLSVTLTHEDTGTTVSLLDRPGQPLIGWIYGCPEDDVDVVLSDEATNLAEDACESTPPAIGGTLKGSGSLGAFDGEDLAGSWTLAVTDNEAADTGVLSRWCLVPTVEIPPSPTDTDGDGTADTSDNCVNVSNASQTDTDEDGFGDACDTCRLAANPEQTDTDGDGYGNRCDPDFDNNDKIGAFDLNVFRSCFIDMQTSSLCVNADFDNNGSMGASDLNIFREYFIKGDPGPGPSGPE
ncbi:proprotein convertase P-domain-containing protein [Myxococcota bacterium]|nr:proprotein convertase P-domain-containing protein [Myxococcota bacterium]